MFRVSNIILLVRKYVEALERQKKQTNGLTDPHTNYSICIMYVTTVVDPPVVLSSPSNLTL